MTGTHHFLTDQRFGTSPVHRLDARAKIVGFVGLTVVSVSTPADAVWAFALYGCVLFFLLGLSRLPVTFVLRRALVVLPFVLAVAIFVPFFDSAGAGGYNLGGVHVTQAGLLVLWNVAAKAFIGVISAVLLVSTTSFAELMAALERLRVPRVFILVASFMYRYAFLLTEEFQRMRRAMTARNYEGRWFLDAPVMGQVLSSLFLRSYARGERVYVAMMSRGYDGSARLSSPSSFGLREAAFLGGLAVTLSAIRLTTLL
jgi:cobalt/nickel transport system permease protein